MSIEFAITAIIGGTLVTILIMTGTTRSVSNTRHEPRHKKKPKWLSWLTLKAWLPKRAN